jgi:F-type H+-transporting ATPase subunit delta
MQEGTVGRRYARALILALEGAPQEKLAKIEEELTALANLLDRRTGSPEFRQAMLNPSFTQEQRKAVIKALVEANKLDAMTLTFVTLLIDKDRLQQLPSVARAFQGEVDEKLGRVRATILTAKELSPQAIADIVRGLEKQTGKKVVPDVEVDPSVIAGVRARIGGTVYDATVRSQLDRLKAELMVQ